jgi:putative lipoic acid-binding regulatory protein
MHDSLASAVVQLIRIYQARRKTRTRVNKTGKRGRYINSQHDLLENDREDFDL